MAKIDYHNPDPERGIFGCIHANNEYKKSKNDLLGLEVIITSLSLTLDHFITEASGVYYTSNYGPSNPFKTSARDTIENLEKVEQKVARFIADIRNNLLREPGVSDKQYSFFISYSHKDSRFVKRFVDDLRRSGHVVWRDEDNVPLGASIRRSIESGMSSSRFVIIVVSRYSIESEWCQKELDMALCDETTKKIKVLPIIIGDCAVPKVLSGKRHIVFGDYKRNYRKFLAILPDNEDKNA